MNNIKEYLETNASRNPEAAREIAIAILEPMEEKKYLKASAIKLMNCKTWAEAARQTSIIGDPFERTGRHAELYQNKELKHTIAFLIEKLGIASRDEQHIKYVLAEVGIKLYKEQIIEKEQKGLFKTKKTKEIMRVPKTMQELLKELR